MSDKFTLELHDKAVQEFDRNITEQDIQNTEDTKIYNLDLYNKKIMPERE